MKTRLLAMLAVIAAAMAPAPVRAAEPLAEDMVAMAECLAAAGEEPLACLGRIQKPCLDQPGGETTGGSMVCAERERQVWSVRLDTSTKSVEAKLTPERLDIFRAAQKAWIEYRDALCKYEASVYLGGSLAKVVASDCLLRETAARSVEIDAEAREAITE